MLTSPHFLYSPDDSIASLHGIRSLEPTALTTALSPHYSSDYLSRRLDLAMSIDCSLDILLERYSSMAYID